MLKSELVTKIAEQHPHLHQRDVEAIINAILTTITGPDGVDAPDGLGVPE